MPPVVLEPPALSLHSSPTATMARMHGQQLANVMTENSQNHSVVQRASMSLLLSPCSETQFRLSNRWPGEISIYPAHYNHEHIYTCSWPVYKLPHYPCQNVVASSQQPSCSRLHPNDPIYCRPFTLSSSLNNSMTAPTPTPTTTNGKSSSSATNMPSKSSTTVTPKPHSTTSGGT
jgi:hypothetical protein